MSTRNLLVVIPHYFGSSDLKGRHGSTTSERSQRAAVLRRTIMGLHQTFGTEQCVMQLDRRRTDAANQAYRFQVRVVLCTHGNSHLIEDLGLPIGRVEQRAVSEPPTQLGFACHDFLAAAIDSADWFAYLEDDLWIHDATLIEKLNWFISIAGDDSLLMPNRFERASAAMAAKAYVDGDLPNPVTQSFQNLEDRPELDAEFLGSRVKFVRARNPHSGCFFLSKSQLRRWLAHESFLDRTTRFIGPLETAATLSVMRCFRVYKPAIENAAFLEIEHQSTQFISQLRR